MPVREAAVAVAAADKDGEAVEVAAAGQEWDAEWPADRGWAQTSNPHSRAIPGCRAHIARSARVRIKTFSPGKAEARMDSARASRAEAQVDSVRASKAEAWAQAARVLDAGT